MLKKKLFFAPKIQDLEKLEKMRAGEISIRQTLQTIVPYHGDRESWLFSVSQRTGLPKKRVRSLFYNRQCRLWAEELTSIQRAASAHYQSVERCAEELKIKQETVDHELANELQELLARANELIRKVVSKHAQ